MKVELSNIKNSTYYDQTTEDKSRVDTATKSTRS